MPDHPCRTCKVGKHAIYGALYGRSPRMIETARDKTIELRAHQSIQRPGVRPNLIYVIKDGWVSREVHVTGRERHILSFLLPGDVINENAAWNEKYKASSAIRAMTDVLLCVFEVDSFRNLIEADDDCVVPHLEHRIAELEDRLLNLGGREAISRISQLVLNLEARLRSRGLARGSSFAFPLRQQDIGDKLGLTTAHVNRTIGALREKGVLDISESRAQILNRAELEILAEGV